MKFAELKNFFSQNPNATESDFLAQSDNFHDWDFTKKKVDTPEGMKALQSILDRERTKAIQSYDEKTVPTKVEKLLAEKLSEREKEWKKQHNINDDPALIEVEKLRAELKQSRAEAQREKLLGIAKTKLPAELHNFADRFLDDDEERTSLRVDLLMDAYNKSVNSAVENTLKGGKMTPNKGTDKAAGKAMTKENMMNMSDREILSGNRDEILKEFGFIK